MKGHVRSTINLQQFRSRIAGWFILLIGVVSLLLLPQPQPARAQVPSAMSGADETQKIPNDQLDSLVAPIAVYPDPLLGQVLVASTYPLELMQLQDFLNQNPYLKDKALGDAVALKPWDPSVQALAIFPEAVKRMADALTWTTDLGNAFLAQESDVMDSVQRMRRLAQQKGTLQSSEQQKVESETAGANEIITIEPADPEMVYVPYYDPTMVYGALVYPYPPIYYPPPGYYEPGRAIAFAVAIALGKAWNGGWGYACAWGNRDINVNTNNVYVRNSTRTATGIQGNLSSPNNLGGATKWQHNPVHRGGAPYGNRQLANKYGGVIDNLGGGNRLDGGGRANNLRDTGRLNDGTNGANIPATRANGGDRIGDQNASSFGDAGAFNGGNRDFSNASSNRGGNSMNAGGFHGGGGGGGGGRGGGRRR